VKLQRVNLARNLGRQLLISRLCQCVRVCETSHLENLRGCVKDKNCRSYKDGKGGRYLDTLEYVCSEDHKGGAYRLALRW